MFKVLLDKNYEVELKDDSKITIIKERHQYEDIIMFVLQFTKEHKLLVSNIDLLLDKQNYWEAVHIFTLKADETAKELVSKLCKKFDEQFLLKLFEIDKEYYVEYNLRRICVLNAIEPYKTFTLYDFISPIKHNVSDSLTIYLLPYFIEIIHLYADLYNPATAASWESVYEDVKKIEIHVDKEIEHFLTMSKEDILVEMSSSGGMARGAPSQHNMVKEAKCSKRECGKKNVANIKGLVRDFIKDEHYILCSEFDGEGPIELISANIDKDFELLSNFLLKFISYGISYKKKTLYLPKEFQMEKYNFYLEMPTKLQAKKHFLTIYNNMSYELINYFEKNGFKYADPITQLRFSYLSIWSSIISQKTHGLHYDKFIQFIKTKKEQLKELRKKIDIYELKKNYAGTYIAASVGKKLLMPTTTTKSSFYCHDFQP